MKKTLYWIPRILSIALILFFSMFAFDVFDQPQWFLALLIHLIPSFILIMLTLIAWKREYIGGLLFILIGFIMLRFYNSMVIASPALLIGILFLTENHINKENNK